MTSDLPPHDGLEPDTPALPPPAPAEPVPRRTARRGVIGPGAATMLVALLVLLVAGIAAEPFWGPPLQALLPWSGNGAAEREPTLPARLAALERQNAALTAAQTVLSRRLGEDAAALAGLGRRIDKLAAEEAARPAPDPAVLRKLQRDVAGLDAHAGDLAGRIAAVQSGLAGLGQRVDALAAQAAARPAVDPATVQKLQGDLAGLDRRAGDLANRIAALETRMAAPARPERREAALLVTLLQMRESLDAAPRFAAPYAAFLALAQGRPHLLAAATPLAAAAHQGVASRAALARDLSHLGGAIATARTPAAADDWSGRVLDQLRRLVTIRHVGGGHQTPSEAAVERAETALAGGDLAGAAAAIETLSGPAAAAARPWLAAARRRLAAETALARLQRRLEDDVVQPEAPASRAAAPAPPAPPRPGPGAH